MDIPELETWAIVAIGGGAALVLALIVFAIVASRGRSRADRKPEVEHSRFKAGVLQSVNAQPNDFQSRKARISPFSPVELSAGDRARYEERLAAIRADFVDHPAGALARADELALAVMNARGYHSGAGNEADIADCDPEVSKLYTSAQAISLRAENNATTEELRRGMQGYRQVIETLIGIHAERPVAVAASA